TWNVQHGRSHEDGRVDLDRFAAAVGELDADVLALQEVDRVQPRSSGADLTALAADALGAPHHRFAPAIEGEPGGAGPCRRTAPPDIGWVCGTEERPAADVPGYGVALLSRRPVLGWRVLRLPSVRVRRPVLCCGPPRVELAHEEPRVALAARIRTPEGAVTVVTTHLSCVPGRNLVQLRHVVAALGGDGPFVLLGDLNAGARAVRAATGLATLVTGSTFPSWSPILQLDHALGRGVTRLDAQVRRLPVSDHCALAVTVR
ncbi:endonuclease/exonuclease/phosphatase family protein, partial [Actinomycetospora sp.]|uniref:endonuclease/exonuclease/phosphatase family protein n=1 Tax=Actinomycetospora sp. TaxID=1872135 RepID=UPI002F3F8A6D